MSHWTYVNGTIHVRTPFYSCKVGRIKEYIEWSIAQVKRYGIDITGSEGPARFFVNAGGHPSCYSSETADTWDYGFVTVMGSLRDREDEETLNEADLFLKRLEHFLRLETIRITVSGDKTKTIDGNAYSKINAFDDDWEKNEKYRDKLFNIQLKNSHRFFDQMLTLEKASEIAEILTHVSPDTLEGLLCNFGVGRTFDWDFTDRRKDWFKEHKVVVRPLDQSCFESWYKKRRWPKKVSAEEIEDELDELAYSDDRYDITEQERKKFAKLRNIVHLARQNEDVMKEVERWD
jgi:hypothetical protein